MAQMIPIILAAGESKRMGFPKPLLDFNSQKCLDLVINNCNSANLPTPIVVLGADHDLIIKGCKLNGCHVVFNVEYGSGQTSSLKHGLKNLPFDANSFLIYPADLPMVCVETINKLKKMFLRDSNNIIIPTYKNKRGHPVICGIDIKEEFLGLADSDPAHLVIRKDKSRVIEIQVEDEAITLPLNTQDDYKSLLMKYFP